MKFKWFQKTIDNRQVNICEQPTGSMQCGYACLAMILNRLGTYGNSNLKGRQIESKDDIPKTSNLNFNKRNGINTYSLYMYIRNNCCASAKLWGDKESGMKTNSIYSFKWALQHSTPQKPAIVVVKGHYMVCEGPVRNSQNSFVILDPSHARCYLVKLETKENVNSLTITTESYDHWFEFQGIITTAKIPLRKPPQKPTGKKKPKILKNKLTKVY